MAAYYNDIDPFVCDWLEALIGEGLIAPGVVDRRRIEEVEPKDLDGFTQCHFFAGIGGWSLALRMAGWPDDRPVWTGSCPCQPFSSAGKRKGVEDERHVWPAFHRLIAECAPATCFGEQVASADGRLWLAGVFADLEALGYRTAGADLCAAGVGVVGRPRAQAAAGRLSRLGDWAREHGDRWLEQIATRAAADVARVGLDGPPHIRQRLYWVADATGVRCDELPRWEQNGSHGQGRMFQPQRKCTERERVGNAGEPGLEGLAGHGHRRDQPGRHGTPAGGHAAQAGAWSDCRLVECREPTRDGAARTVYRRAPVEPALFPVAHGLPGRVGLLRGAGNAIVPQVAAEFVRACLPMMPDA